MTYRIGNLVVIIHEPPKQCQNCKKIKECRPFGPHGEDICFDCAKQMYDTKTLDKLIDNYMFPKKKDHKSGLN